jgi:hypothetical protein
MKLTIMRVMPMSIMKPNTLRQPKATWIQPPTTGAIAGAMPNIIVMVLIRRCASGPSCRSRTMARPMAIPTPALIPCTARNVKSHAKLGDTAQPIDAAA